LVVAIAAISSSAVAQTQVTITGTSPPIAAPGHAVVIEGGSFTGATSVTFGGATAVFQVDTANAITAIVPLAAATGPIEVVPPAGPAVSSQTFEVVAQSWDAAKDFSIASNPAGQWSYGVAPSLGGADSPAGRILLRIQIALP
jgi:hypothetical protein